VRLLFAILVGASLVCLSVPTLAQPVKSNQTTVTAINKWIKPKRGPTADVCDGIGDYNPQYTCCCRNPTNGKYCLRDRNNNNCGYACSNSFPCS
jgi:hypothetical protein